MSASGKSRAGPAASAASGLENGVIKTVGLGRCRLPRPDDKKRNKGCWLSPRMRGILERGWPDSSEALQAPGHDEEKFKSKPAVTVKLE